MEDNWAKKMKIGKCFVWLLIVIDDDLEGFYSGPVRLSYGI